jgi:cell division septum initiation protein DivIVA
MDIHDKLEEIVQIVEAARAMPMSASCLVNREEMLDLLDELRRMLPDQLERADQVISGRDALIAEGHESAAQLVDSGRQERERLVDEQSVVVAARERAAAVTGQAQAESERLLADADEYVDRKLAEFEIALDKLTAQVRRGRERLGQRRGAHALDTGEGDIGDADQA